jgi:hypothetical protein
LNQTSQGLHCADVVGGGDDGDDGGGDKGRKNFVPPVDLTEDWDDEGDDEDEDDLDLRFTRAVV